MHLLVLSAFRLGHLTSLVTPSLSQCTFWCSVLSDPSHKPRLGVCLPSQCTFWCSVLSDLKLGGRQQRDAGSQCTFWCSVLSDTGDRGRPTGVPVSMHLLVLSAFRRHGWLEERRQHVSQCTFWCSVLSDGEGTILVFDGAVSQCTFWCSVLSDENIFLLELCMILSQCTFWCSVLSDAYGRLLWKTVKLGLNAPFGAQCFPT
mgnify:CR=1 FL=1